MVNFNSFIFIKKDQFRVDLVRTGAIQKMFELFCGKDNKLYQVFIMMTFQSFVRAGNDNV